MKKKHNRTYDNICDIHEILPKMRQKRKRDGMEITSLQQMVPSAHTKISKQKGKDIVRYPGRMDRKRNQPTKKIDRAALK
jgi:hypothetical protein